MDVGNLALNKVKSLRYILFLFALLFVLHIISSVLQTGVFMQHLLMAIALLEIKGVIFTFHLSCMKNSIPFLMATTLTEGNCFHLPPKNLSCMEKVKANRIKW